ncbi:hypothetical protein L3Q72_05250 [Vibrio sp. JC009]|uniref:hypothetical protein n=1 Tax=Vibrio sp. JC009 TaxID=2912314 RepID=UPI0023B0FB3D|nr:hypothetical protein [Vibrio sp. JC009]WED22799.1 hypothetical protein L3Q72_05250 [Vibrio sp. JC009]
MMNAIKFITEKGREISVREMSISYTYAGSLEGTREAVSEYNRAKWAKSEEEQPRFLLIDDSQPVLPDHQVIVTLRSEDGIKGGDYSELTVTFFTDNPDQRPSFMIASVITDEVWESSATDLSYDGYF